MENQENNVDLKLKRFKDFHYIEKLIQIYYISNILKFYYITKIDYNLS